MKRVPFNVSARTARLIGRENLSSAEGALIELVKNSYDADANFCIVYFDDSFAELPQIATKEQLEKLNEITQDSKISSCYEADIFDDFRLSEQLLNKNLTKAEQAELRIKLSRTVQLHILDDGDGMTEEIIEKSWMTIGTDNKSENYYSSKSGRIKSGAKGIGRFALDRLGEKCTLLTKTEKSDSTLLWKVSWNDFDQQGVTIDKVNAELGPSSTNLDKNLENILEENKTLLPSPAPKKGTHIKISIPRDAWGKLHVERIFQELESLAPPSEAGKFSIFVFSRAHPELFGKISPTACEDYDYKLHAKMDDQGEIELTINRNEIDPSKITRELLNSEYLKSKNTTPSQLCNEPIVYRKKLAELFPGITEHNEKSHELIGPFDFTLYFLKKQSDKTDTETFLHRKFNFSTRKKWLDNNSGIRIYRDNFRVRPYGEIDKASWDWLGLGNRAAEDPSALRTGRWKVSPGSISGAINISRVNNRLLQDKSSREGMAENDAFLLFKKIIEQLIKEFENDRSSIYRDIYAYSLAAQNTPTDEHLSSDQEIDAEALAQEIFDSIKSSGSQDVKDTPSKLAVALLKAKAKTREIDGQLEEMKRENSLLRVFASSGLTIASFTHELDGLNAKLGGRFDKLTELIR
ncbi:TPA: ATP-binding protein, partial [Pseudomonas aeruginosa]|nr:ATP-binding protein [Pseudomonas aeruginosa]